MTIVTVEDLTQAIKNSIDTSRGMVEEQAYGLARHVLNFFGYSDRIIDNVLEPEDRDAFYMLEDAGILGGLPVEGGVLWCATEKVAKSELDRAIAIVKEVCAG